MKKETISEAMKNISEDYVLEALELHNREVVSDETDMKSKNIKKMILIVAVAAAITAALGISAYAAFGGGMNVRDAEPSEVATNKYTQEETEADETVEGIEIDDVKVYDGMTKMISFDGPSECQEIRIKLNSLPEGYEMLFGELGEWSEYDIQGGVPEIIEDDGELFETVGDVFNIRIFYAATFGTDGNMLFFDTFDYEAEDQIGENIIYKMSGTSLYNEELSIAYYIIYNPTDGYIVVISGRNLDICESLVSDLEIEKTGNLADVQYDPECANEYMGNGVG